MDTTKAELVTRKHIQRVSELCNLVAKEMMDRGVRHDSSKFLPIELEPLQRMQDLIEKEGQAQFGTPEYKRRTDLLGEMITHHRANNSHHPEYYADGISGMNLFDILEMFVDWKAASERSESSVMGLEFGISKFEIDSQLASIFRNTADYLGWEK